MKEHPVPQNIASYQFHLVGSMTLKQFLELAGGILFAWLIIASKLTVFIKWPVAIFSGLFGAALAFMPIEERPLDVWLINFAKTLYWPTQFIWEKSQLMPAFFQTKKRTPAKTTPRKTSAEKDASLEAYLKTLPDDLSQSPLDQAELGYLDRVQALFGITKVKSEALVIKTLPKTTPSVDSQASALGIKVRRLKPIQAAKSRPIKPVIPVAQTAIKVRKTELTTKSPAKPKPNQAEPRVEPVETPVERKPLEKPDFNKGKKVVPVKFSPQLPLPYKPKEPNLLVGMVFDAQDHILTNTIIEIKDANDNPARALKTNKLGQFSIATPLKNGTYFIEAEHDQKHFDIMKLEIKGELVPPIEIRSVD